MKTKCSFCGSFISDTDEICPNCGAVNENLMRSADGIPKTIEELKAFSDKHNLPLKDMRFFLGEDFKEPKAFGIYKDDDGNFVVYKNKADGSRAVRYQGKDEAYAVNEIYQKMRSEIRMRKQQKPSENDPDVKVGAQKAKQAALKKKRKIADFFSIFLVIFLLVLYVVLSCVKSPGKGYYNYDDTYYYYDSSSWYYYDDYNNQWEKTYSIDDELSKNYKDYSSGSDYSTDFGIDNFNNSQYYLDHNNSNSYWNDSWDDDDWDWDSNDSWDYNDSDWDSDW